MTNLDRLIAEHCPNGVEFVKLSDVCVSVSSGGTPNTGRSDYYGGDIPSPDSFASLARPQPENNPNRFDNPNV